MVVAILLLGRLARGPDLQGRDQRQADERADGEGDVETAIGVGLSDLPLGLPLGSESPRRRQCADVLVLGGFGVDCRSIHNWCSSWERKTPSRGCGTASGAGGC